MRAATSLLLAGAFLVVSFSITCGADELIEAQVIQRGTREFSTGADAMALLNKLFPLVNDTRTARQRPSLLPEIVSRLPVSRLFDLGSKAADMARFWPAGLASLIVGTAPTSGAIVGIVAISIFVIVIWLVIYSIGVLPVGAALGRNDMFQPDMPFMPDGPYPGGMYPYNRFKRSMAEASANVMNAMDQFQLKQLNNKEKLA